MCYVYQDLLSALSTLETSSRIPRGKSDVTIGTAMFWFQSIHTAPKTYKPRNVRTQYNNILYWFVAIYWNHILTVSPTLENHEVSILISHCTWVDCKTHIVTTSTAYLLLIYVLALGVHYLSKPFPKIKRVPNYFRSLFGKLSYHAIKQKKN